jgi:hypothetical protein
MISPRRPTRWVLYLVIVRQPTPKIKICQRMDLSQRDPDIVFGPSGVLEAWGTKAKKPHSFRKRMICWPCRLRRQGKKHDFHQKVRFGHLSTPGLQKKHLVKKHFGIPLSLRFGLKLPGPAVAPGSENRPKKPRPDLFVYLPQSLPSECFYSCACTRGRH